MIANTEWERAQRGELYHAFIPELIAARDRCKQACDRLNTSSDLSRRRMIELWRGVTNDPRPLPPRQSTGDADDKILSKEPWVFGPIHADYGFNIILGEGAMLNYNSTFVDTCPIIIGARTLMGPNCSFYSGTHPLDPAVRNGTDGPELGKPINIGDDCWLGGNVIVLPGVTIGRGCTIGAGSVVTKDIPAFHVAAGNPARVLKKIETTMDPSYKKSDISREDAKHGAETVMAESMDH
ncbi:hypothetical protein, variant [Exophiala xenobiotica]|uniref:Maltose/galactoside acetyltransferase domain-containing protein n=1 Tax=Exophiala xenobiotica TaxID=348802 RepID=A0A0D2CH09_9EURO|nr:hypothetical protein, variant [Exophiala xenobiotica]XP_013309711.1 uncharacterized protein PV05_10835 [Exophiala xenobiotica]KIW49126.1 hypothetical protein PV05_10835 [Exophiala xenobiotica]KIW49127.1 hypothetical protein, variant [Exophiala xenobiotica]